MKFSMCILITSWYQTKVSLLIFCLDDQSTDVNGSILVLLYYCQFLEEIMEPVLLLLSPSFVEIRVIINYWGECSRSTTL